MTGRLALKSADETTADQVERLTVRLADIGTVRDLCVHVDWVDSRSGHHDGDVGFVAPGFAEETDTGPAHVASPHDGELGLIERPIGMIGSDREQGLGLVSRRRSSFGSVETGFHDRLGLGLKPCLLSDFLFKRGDRCSGFLRGASNIPRIGLRRRHGRRRNDRHARHESSELAEAIGRLIRARSVGHKDCPTQWLARFQRAASRGAREHHGVNSGGVGGSDIRGIDRNSAMRYGFDSLVRGLEHESLGHE